MICEKCKTETGGPYCVYCVDGYDVRTVCLMTQNPSGGYNDPSAEEARLVAQLVAHTVTTQLATFTAPGCPNVQQFLVNHLGAATYQRLVRDIAANVVHGLIQ